MARTTSSATFRGFTAGATPSSLASRTCEQSRTATRTTGGSSSEIASNRGREGGGDEKKKKESGGTACSGGPARGACVLGTAYVCEG
jgi:hypothetical protein